MRSGSASFLFPKILRTLLVSFRNASKGCLFNMPVGHFLLVAYSPPPVSSIFLFSKFIGTK